MIWLNFGLPKRYYNAFCSAWLLANTEYAHSAPNNMEINLFAIVRPNPGGLSINHIGRSSDLCSSYFPSQNACLSTDKPFQWIR